MLDRRLVEDVASRLDADAGLAEKDWHVTRAIGVLAGLDHRGSTPTFGGGTSLSKAWGLIRRFSEDIDFKVTMPPASRNRARREWSVYRERILAALAAAAFEPMGELVKRDENRFFSPEFLFPSLFDTRRGLCPYISVEVSLAPPGLPAAKRSISSLIAQADGQSPEVPAILAVDPVETAANKLSALAWRVHARRRGSAGDDPSIIRHLQDLATLGAAAGTSPEFPRLVRGALAADKGRGGEAAVPSDPTALFAGMFDRLATDKLWATEYEDFVRQASIADRGELVGFDAAPAALRDLVALLGTEGTG